MSDKGKRAGADRRRDSAVVEQGRPCHGTPSVSDSCNRLPFVSDDECDRGQVDVRQFDDLPICGGIDPTEPGIPPEVIVTPWVLPPPVPCACIDIEYNVKFNRYTGYRTQFASSTSFKSKGDCCEGEYELDFDFSLPCPFDTIDEDKTIKINQRWNCKNDNNTEKTYLKKPEDECAIDPLDVSFEIGLQCPVVDGNENITINIDWENQKTDTKQYITAVNSGCGDDQNVCKIDPVSPVFDLGLPCPIKGSDTSISISIGWDVNDPDNGTSKQIIDTETGKDCSITCTSQSFNLSLPCPIPNNDEAKVAIGIGYGEDFDPKDTTTKKTIVKKKTSECTLDLSTATFDLKIPCPLENLNFATNVVKGDSWGLYVSKQDVVGKECAKDITFTLVVGAAFPGSSSGSSSSGSSSSSSSSSSEESSSSGGKPDCVEVISGGYWSGTDLHFTTTRLCGRFTIDGEGSVIHLTTPVTGHVNKCCNN